MNGFDHLNDYRQSGSEHAFSELVRRLAGLVYSVAKRQVHDSQVAEDVVQTVFTRLAQAPPPLHSDGELVAWLHRTTVHVAIDAWRSETRRRAREQKAAAMEPAGVDVAKTWEEIAPHLDGAIDQLSSADREAVLLRFFHGQSMREVGLALGVSEDAAKMRVGRAVERLRTALGTKGVTCSIGILSGLLVTSALEAAPAHLIEKLLATRLLTSSAALASGTLPFVLRSILMATNKTAVALVLAAALGLGAALYHRINSRVSLNQEGRAPLSKTLVRPGTNGSLLSRTSKAGGLASQGDAVPVKDLLEQLRAMLNMPKPARSYPPSELRTLLAEFGDRASEAVPVLLEEAASADYESRCWAIGGLRWLIDQSRNSNSGELARTAFVAARPVLAPILQAENEPNLLRMMALSIFVPSIIYDGSGLPLTLAGFEPGAVDDLILALRTRDKTGFRFSLVDALGQYFAARPDEVEAFRQAMLPLLEDPLAQHRFLAAFALATWPGEKPPGVKRELLRELRERSTYSHHAAMVMSQLGVDATDTIPDLLDYAAATKLWGAGYATAALETACRIKPELRAAYPEIDEKMRRDEAARQQLGQAPSSLGEWIAQLAKGNDAQFRQSLLSSFVNASDNPAETRQAFLAKLQDERKRAPESQRAALDKAIELVQNAPAEEPAVAVKGIMAANLTLDARVLLTETNHPKRSQIDAVLDQFDQERISSDPHMKLTAENYAKLARALREVDPAFQSEWRKALLLNYPWLDRVLPKDEL